MEEINNIKKRIFNTQQKNSEELFIKRVPKDTIELFKKHANDNYCGDYGFCLQSIVTELIVKQPIYITLQEQIFELYKEIEQLKLDNETREINNTDDQNNKSTKSKIIRTEDGRRVIKKN